MKIIALILLVFLSSCATTMSEYEQGCYDGLDTLINLYNQDSVGETAKYMENIKMNICISLQEKQMKKARRARQEFISPRRNIN